MERRFTCVHVLVSLISGVDHRGDVAQQEVQQAPAPLCLESLPGSGQCKVTAKVQTEKNRFFSSKINCFSKLLLVFLRPTLTVVCPVPPKFLVCVSMILWNFLAKKEDNLPGKILTFTLLYGSLYSTYIWTGVVCVRASLGASYLLVQTEISVSASGLIPLCLALTNRDDLLRLRPGVFMVLGWG